LEKYCTEETLTAMHRIAFTIFVTFLAASMAYSSGNDEPVEMLKTRFETAHPEDRVDLGIRIAQDQLRNADKLYIDGNVDLAQAAVEDIVTYSEKARDASTQTKRHTKNLEINVRKMSEKLRDIKRTLAFEDQPPIEKAIRRLEDIRTALLAAMFADDKKNDKKGKK
jgi:hypothetical protein